MKTSFINNVKISGTGSYLPDTIITNSQLEKAVKTTSDEWIFKNLGIKQRRVATYEKTSDLATEAAKKAMEASGVTDINLIIVATSTPDMKAPATACIVHNKLNLLPAVCFDINAVCSGFIYALSLGTQLVSDTLFDNALIIGVDTFSTITNWEDRSCVFFGDGAGAVILSREQNKKMSFLLEADGSKKDVFMVPKDFFIMDGKKVFDIATEVLPVIINKVLSDNNLSANDIDYVIPHQPSKSLLVDVARKIGIPFEKVMTNMENYANTSAATIPILLDETVRSKDLSNKKLLLAAVGSGFTWGAGILWM